jgi:hypothetical protein
MLLIQKSMSAEDGDSKSEETRYCVLIPESFRVNCMEYYSVDSFIVLFFSVVSYYRNNNGTFIVTYSGVPDMQFYHSVSLQLITYFIVSMACGGLAWQKCVGN